MSEKKELVSVVLCTYNGSAFVAEQLTSILQQTYAHLEVIVADDASSDDTYAILEGYAASDRRIVLYKNEHNTGYNINFSNACARSSGSYIAIADQDDIWEKTKLEELVKKIKEKEDTVLVHGISARFEEKGKPHLRSTKLVNYFKGNDIRLFFLSNFISGHNMLFKRKLLDKALPFPKEVYYDWWLAAQACTIGTIEAVEKIQVWHRMHAQNATGAAKPKLLFYKQVQTILPLILNIDGIQKEHYQFGKQILDHFFVFPKKEFSWPLYRFLMRHAHVIFSYKKRIFPWISYAKYARRYAKRSTLA